MILMGLADDPGIKPGTTDNRLAGLQDVMPTLLDMAGIEVPETCDGISMLGNAKRELLYGDVLENNSAVRMMHDGRHKLIWYPAGNRGPALRPGGRSGRIDRCRRQSGLRGSARAAGSRARGSLLWQGHRRRLGQGREARGLRSRALRRKTRPQLLGAARLAISATSRTQRPRQYRVSGVTGMKMMGEMAVEWQP